MRSAFVIQDANQPGLYLGAGAWTKHRPAALEFVREGDAQDWIESVRSTTPLMLKDRALKVSSKPMEEPLPPIGGHQLRSDFDPWRGVA